jgi:hypothetical protein
MRLRVFDAEDLRAPVLDERLSVSAAEELLRVPPDLRPHLVDQAIREQWTPAQARRARLDARAKCLESKHLPVDDLEGRFRALSTQLETLQATQIPRGAHREGQRLLALLTQIVGQPRRSS